MPEEQPTQETQPAMVQEQVPGKVVFSFKKPTPLWATWIFRVVFVMNFAGAAWIAGTDSIKPTAKVQDMLILTIIDRAVWGIGKGMGIKKKDFEEEQ